MLNVEIFLQKKEKLYKNGANSLNMAKTNKKRLEKKQKAKKKAKCC